MSCQKEVLLSIDNLVSKDVNKAWNTHVTNSKGELDEPWNQERLKFIQNVFDNLDSLINAIKEPSMADYLCRNLGIGNYVNLKNKYIALGMNISCMYIIYNIVDDVNSVSIGLTKINQQLNSIEESIDENYKEIKKRFNAFYEKNEKRFSAVDESLAKYKNHIN